MFNFSDIILEKNRAEKAIASGQVTGGNINKVLNTGGARGLQTHLSGLEKGTDNILKKTNATEHNGLLGKISPITLRMFGHNSVHIPPKNSDTLLGRIVNAKDQGIKGLFKSSKNVTPVIRRHEADEARDKSNAPMSFMHNGKQVGQHLSPKVLQREHDHVSYLSKLDPSIKSFEGLRKSNNEYSKSILGMGASKLRKLKQRAEKHFVDNVTKTASAANNLKTKFSNASGFLNKAKTLVSGYKELSNLNKNKIYKVDLDK